MNNFTSSRLILSSGIKLHCYMFYFYSIYFLHYDPLYTFFMHFCFVIFMFLYFCVLTFWCFSHYLSSITYITSSPYLICVILPQLCRPPYQSIMTLSTASLSTVSSFSFFFTASNILINYFLSLLCKHTHLHTHTHTHGHTFSLFHWLTYTHSLIPSLTLRLTRSLPDTILLSINICSMTSTLPHCTWTSSPSNELGQLKHPLIISYLISSYLISSGLIFVLTPFLLYRFASSYLISS